MTPVFPVRFLVRFLVQFSCFLFPRCVVSTVKTGNKSTKPRTRIDVKVFPCQETNEEDVSYEGLTRFLPVSSLRFLRAA